MKSLSSRLVMFLVLAAAVSCDEPDTVVTDVVHPDGSIARKIEMRNSSNKFEKKELQLPFDSTWVVRDTCEVDPKGDTTWIKTAEKLFSGVEEINREYQDDSSINGKYSRFSVFRKKFRWFYTEYRFGEVIDKRVETDYPLACFLNPVEHDYFYAPDFLKYSREHGPDSIRFRQIADTVEKKKEDWSTKIFASIWARELGRLTDGKIWTDSDTGALKAAERKTISVIDKNRDKFDSLWSAGVLQRRIIGDSLGVLYRNEADSAFDFTLNEFLADFRSYSVRIVMPGKLIGTNGYMDSTKTLIWPVNSDFFLTDRYEMWAESRTTNTWAWILSVLFLSFVVIGLLIQKSPAARRDQNHNLTKLK
jgi:hypothetical protein